MPHIRLSEKEVAIIRKAFTTHFPLTEEKLDKMSDDDFPWLDMMTSRFSKLVDIIGNKIFNANQEQNLVKYWIIPAHRLKLFCI